MLWLSPFPLNGCHLCPFALTAYAAPPFFIGLSSCHACRLAQAFGFAPSAGVLCCDFAWLVQLLSLDFLGHPFPLNRYRFVPFAPAAYAASTFFIGLSSCHAFRFAQAFGSFPSAGVLAVTLPDLSGAQCLDFLGSSFPLYGYRFVPLALTAYAASTLFIGLSSCHAFRVALAFGDSPVSRSSCCDLARSLGRSVFRLPWQFLSPLWVSLCSFSAYRLCGFHPFHWTVLLPYFPSRTGFWVLPRQPEFFAVTSLDWFKLFSLGFLGRPFPLNRYRFVPSASAAYTASTLFIGLSSCYAFRVAQAFGFAPSAGVHLL